MYASAERAIAGAQSTMRRAASGVCQTVAHTPARRTDTSPATVPATAAIPRAVPTVVRDTSGHSRERRAERREAEVGEQRDQRVGARVRSECRRLENARCEGGVRHLCDEHEGGAAVCYQSTPPAMRREVPESRQRLCPLRHSYMRRYGGPHLRNLTKACRPGHRTVVACAKGVGVPASAALTSRSRIRSTAKSERRAGSTRRS